MAAVRRQLHPIRTRPDDGTGDTEPPTEEEIAEEAQVAGYLENMCRAYVRYQDTVENSAYVVSR